MIYRWVCLADIVQHMWRMGEIPHELRWTALVLINKCSTYNWVIGFMETYGRW